MIFRITDQTFRTAGEPIQENLVIGCAKGYQRGGQIEAAGSSGEEYPQRTSSEYGAATYRRHEENVCLPPRVIRLSDRLSAGVVHGTRQLRDGWLVELRTTGPTSAKGTTPDDPADSNLIVRLLVLTDADCDIMKMQAVAGLRSGIVRKLIPRPPVKPIRA